MKRFIILLVILLVYTSSFPSFLFAEEQEEKPMGGIGETNNEEKDIYQTEKDKGFIDHNSDDDRESQDGQSIIEDKKDPREENMKDRNKKKQKQSDENNDNNLSDQDKKGNGNKKISKPVKETDEYNEYGIKKGTEVYGEDISKLTKEELQYIPEAWRDGKFESEHVEEPRLKARLFANYPDVNKYIASNNLSTAKIEFNHINHLTKFNYRNGFGKPEGLVAHETANNKSTITGEVNYMSNNHKNAFVHAFVDGSRIIEVHPTDYGAWGAGRLANERFIHVELVRTHSFDQFARSINNYSEYIATMLYKYNLGVANAEKSGKGTLWSHDAVSRFLGGTNHVDPHGYFAQWGYNWKDFVNLVNKKYDALATVEGTKTSKLGHLRSGNVRIYNNPVNKNNYNTAGTKYTNEVYYIKSEANIDNTAYYLISREPSSTKGTVGWVKASDMTIHDHKGKDKESKVFLIKGNGKAYNKAWGGSKNLVYNLSSKSGSIFDVNLTETVGNNVWYRGKLSGKQVWIHSSYLNNVESKTSKLGHIRNSKVKIYKEVGNPSTSLTAGKTYTNSVYYIKKQAKVKSQLYYLIGKGPSSTNGVLGWVKSQDLSTHTHVGVDKKAKTFYVKGTGKAYDTAWGGDGNLVFNLSQYKGQIFKVHLTEKVGNNTWYRGVLNGKTVWLHSSYVTSKEESKTSKLGHIRNSKVKIYQELGNMSTEVIAGSTYTNSVYYIKKQAKVNSQVYYLLSKEPSSVRGVVGWVKSQDLSTHTHIEADKKVKIFYVKGTGKAYDTAWGGSKNLVYNLSQYKGQEFKVHLTEKVGSNSWYRGILKGKTVWVHSSYLNK